MKFCEFLNNSFRASFSFIFGLFKYLVHELKVTIDASDICGQSHTLRHQFTTLESYQTCDQSYKIFDVRNLRLVIMTLPRVVIRCHF